MHLPQVETIDFIPLGETWSDTIMHWATPCVLLPFPSFLPSFLPPSHPRLLAFLLSGAGNEGTRCSSRTSGKSASAGDTNTHTPDHSFSFSFPLFFLFSLHSLLLVSFTSFRLFALPPFTFFYFLSHFLPFFLFFPILFGSSSLFAPSPVAFCLSSFSQCLVNSSFSIPSLSLSSLLRSFFYYCCSSFPSIFASCHSIFSREFLL
ncbi:hypothetical protein E2C01_093296 [Portunus trituberculatus]|uniref:Uncharacterized protein n=1 Tax=Portunus trituberculatus TaxID=210409 RepID=A0A5B7JMD3_PORTR|nr:hypothetical protein [Portunus trituberculatus]